MPVAALPGYLQHTLADLPPGHRFGTFFPVWDSQTWARAGDEAKRDALTQVTADFSCFKGLVTSLVARQRAAARMENVLSVPAVSTSPFMTGTGMEHPLENGFAFMNPYGLPYLPGSSIKGVLRRTAELLAKREFGDETHGWDQVVINTLFGPEPQRDEDARRGALLFWDVLIEPRDYKLGMDILTPHFGDYYFKDATPHESGQPIPNPFLVIPPGAKFGFHVQCNTSLIQDQAICSQWKTLVQSVLEHAFDWLGFGAKTAVGYGQLGIDAEQADKMEREAKAAAKAAMSPLDQALDRLDTLWHAEKKLNRKQAGGPLDNLVGDEVRRAVAWSEDEKKTLHEKCREILKWLGKENKKIKEKLAPLNIVSN